MSAYIVNVAQLLLLVLGAPLLRGIIAKVKAVLQRRQGASVFRPYADILKLFRKEDLTPPNVSPIFRWAPLVGFAVTVIAAAFIPVVRDSALLGYAGDFVLLVYLLAIARFFMALGALDAGSAFGGMGASREVMVAALAEAPILLSLVALAIMAHTNTIVGISSAALNLSFFDISTAHTVAFVAVGMAAIAETGRMPVDNPTSHLELTMIHEAMILEYSGPSLALIEWTHALKMNLLFAVIVAVFAPWGMAASASVPAMLLGLALYAVKILAFAGAIALIESSLAKLRMYLVPDFLGIATALGVLAVVFTALIK